jgi:aromatic ring-cleaving dioxygenase
VSGTAHADLVGNQFHQTIPRRVAHQGTACRSAGTRRRYTRSCSRKVFPTLVPLVMMNRMGPTALLHPEAGRPRDDQTLNATWMGAVLTLNTWVLPETD